MSEPQSQCPIAFNPGGRHDNWKARAFTYRDRPDLAALAQDLLQAIQDSGVSVAEALLVAQDLPELITHHARLNFAPSIDAGTAQ